MSKFVLLSGAIHKWKNVDTVNKVGNMQTDAIRLAAFCRWLRALRNVSSVQQWALLATFRRTFIFSR